MAPKGFDPMGIIFIILFIVILYVMMILPAQRRQKAHDKMIQSLKKGDKVVTSGGIYGTITQIKDKTLVLKISDKTEITISKGNIAGTLKREQ